MKDDPHAPIIKSALFRFYAELNDFLAPRQRQINFNYEFITSPSIKDTIEAIGVPHTAVDLILIDGKSVDFGYRMQGSEQVAVYPIFELFDITPLVHLRARPLRKTKFVVDVNLGKLARKLRLLGFDSLYRNDLSDHEIVTSSVQQRRIILTRDRAILKHSSVTHGYWVRNTQPTAQISEVVERLQLINNFRPFTRCSYCNEALHRVDKSLIRELLPNRIYQLFKLFMRCDGCQRIYWQGSHYERIDQWIKQLQQISDHCRH